MLGDQHMGEETRGGQALVDDLCRTGAWVNVRHFAQAHLPRTCRSTVKLPGV